MTASLFLAGRGRWWAAGLCGAAAALTFSSRAVFVGVLLAGALLTARGRPLADTTRLALAAAIAALGFVALFLVFHVAVGAWDAFFRVQAKYGHGGLDFWTLFWGRLRAGFDGHLPSQQSLLVAALVLACAGVLAVDVARRRAVPATDLYVLVYAVAFWLFPYFTTSPGHSYHRGEALLLAAVVLARRLPVAVLVPLLGRASVLAWRMAQLYFRNALS